VLLPLPQQPELPAWPLLDWQEQQASRQEQRVRPLVLPTAR
jgi:hypothetical protein